MSYPDWINEQGLSYELVPYDIHKYRGNLLPGSIVTRLVTKETDIMQQEWSRGAYRIAYRVFRFLPKRIVQARENREVMRLEAVISGELNIVEPSGHAARIRQGQYHVTKSDSYKASFTKVKDCNYFVSYYSLPLLNDLGISEEQLLSSPLAMPERMLQLIQEALHHPHTGVVADIYYRKLVTELLLIHLTRTEAIHPTELSEKDIAAIYQADAILSEDLSEHYSIIQLSGMAGTNAFKLKRGFRLVFKMGVFARLLFRRMEHAKMLLETTSKPIKEVAFESGYSTVGGFINAFRKRFKMTPLDWRATKRNINDG